MDEIWTRLETFLQQNAPQIYAGLAPGATEAEIADAEARCGFPFPLDVRQSYLRHDGQADEGHHFIPSYFYLLPMSCIFSGDARDYADPRNQLSEYAVTDPRIKRVYTNPGWISFASNLGGDALCLDFDPLPSGTAGQIITSDWRWLAPSFRIWMEMIIGDLETGRLIWNAELERYEYPEDEAPGEVSL